MSRQHTAQVEGSAHVEMVCDNCGKTEWKLVAIKHCCACPEWEATQNRGPWHYTDDALVCSEKCADAVFGWSDEDPDPDACEGGFCSAPDGDPGSVYICYKHAPFVYGGDF